MLEIILIVDVGSNFTQMIARKIRELKVYCEIYPYNKIPTNKNIKGIILSDSSYSIDDPNSPKPDFDQLFKADIPILAIGYSAQRLAQHLGGQIKKSATSKNVIANFGDIDPSNTLVQSIKLGSQVLSAGGSVILSIPDNNKIIMRTETSEIVGFQVNSRNIFGIQFHPVADQTADGVQLLENFVVSICQCRQDWTPARFIHDSTKSLKDQLQDDKVVLGLSGGVDSSVAAMLLHKAIGKNLHCIFVDNGLLRKNEFASVLESYHDIGLNIKGVQAADRFYKALAGVTDPEKKRKAIGHIFIEIFDDEAHKIKEVRWLGQGTIYPDIIESAPIPGSTATIKSHHNVGGLPNYMKLKIVEPLKNLFKDEIRRVGFELGLKPEILNRHPFPGPGLGVRVLGEITAERIKILQEADYIFIKKLKECGLYDKVWQALAILLPVQSVGVSNEKRTYENAIALRAVHSTDGMTAEWAHLPYDFLEKVSEEIIRNVKGINRVVYDISSKPPATIEWE